MNRLALLAQSFSSAGVPTARSEQLVHRLERIAKKKRQAKIKRIDRNRKVIQEARAMLAKRIEKAFSKSARNFAKQIIDLRYSLGKADASDDNESKVNGILKQLNFSKWQSIPADVADIYTSVTQDGVRAGWNQIDFTAGEDIVDQANQNAINWARARAAELVGMQFDENGDLIENPDAEWAITDSTREALRTHVTRAIEEGLGSNELADELEASYAFSADRAATIARTELAMADIQGNLIAYRDSGMVSGKELILGSEHDVPDECDEAAEMGIVPIDDDFNGLGDPPFHANCICDLIPVLAEDDEA